MAQNEGTQIGKLLRAKCIERASGSSHSYADAFSHYGLACPPTIVSLGEEFQGGFVERFPRETCHFYSPDDLIRAENHVPIDIRSKGFLPIADCKDNLFICCAPMKSRFFLFGAIDEVEVYSSTALSDVLTKLGIT